MRSCCGRGSRRRWGGGLGAAAVAALIAALAVPPADAANDPTADYSVTMNKVPDGTLGQALQSSSTLIELQSKPPEDVTGLRRRAEDDLERLQKGEAERAVPAVPFVRPIEQDARHAGVIESLQNQLGPLLKWAPSVGHGRPSVLHAVLMAWSAEEWLAHPLDTVARIFLGDVGLQRLGLGDVGPAGSIRILQSGQAAAIERKGALRVGA